VSWHLFEIASAAASAFFLWPFVEGPYLLYKRHSQPLDAPFRVFAGPLKSEFPQYRIRGLLEIGFEFAGQLVQGTHGRNVAVQMQMFIHPANTDSAHLVKVLSGLRTVELLVFKSRFDDGFAFETSDSRTAPIFSPDPNYRVFRFPSLRSTSDLYRLHRRIKDGFSLARRPVLARGDDELMEFIARAEVVRQRHAHSGDYKLGPAGDRYVYTLWGAILHGWLHAWPIKSFRTLRVESRGMKMAKELGLPIHPKFGRLEESVRNFTPTRVGPQTTL